MSDGGIDGDEVTPADIARCYSTIGDVLAQAHNLGIAASTAEHSRDAAESLRGDIEDLADACDRYLGREPRA